MTQRHPVLFGTLFALAGLAVAMTMLLVAGQAVRVRPVVPVVPSTSARPTTPTPPASTPPASTPPASTPPSSTRPPTPSASGTDPSETDEATAWQKLRDNPANQVAFGQHVACTAAKTDAVGLDDTAFTTWVKGLVDTCLVGLWAPGLAAQGISLPDPRLFVIKGTTVDSPCGSVSADEAAAFACLDGIYVFRTTLQQGWGALGAWAMVFALSHEFGHYVQYVTGMFTDDVVLYHGKGTDVYNAISRRIELQATCMGTMVLGSIAWQIPQWDPAADTQSFGGATDEIHGTHENQQYWGTRGYDSRDSHQCNTWAAKDHLA